MASLLSVLLVASSASGSRLLFAYPPNAAATPRVQKPLYGKSSAVRDAQKRSSGGNSDDELRNGLRQHRSAESVHNNDNDNDDAEAHLAQHGLDILGSRFIRGESSSSSSEEADSDMDAELDRLSYGNDNMPDSDSALRRREWYHDQDEYATKEQRETETFKHHLGVDTGVLGTLLCPRKELCNKRFEMVINHLAFIAHPTSVKAKSTRGKHGTTTKENIQQDPPSRRRRHQREGGATRVSESALTNSSEDEDESLASHTDASDTESLPRALSRSARLGRARRGSSSAASTSTSGFPSRRGSRSVPARSSLNPLPAIANPSQLSNLAASAILPATRESLGAGRRMSNSYQPDRNMPGTLANKADLARSVLGGASMSTTLSKGRSLPIEELSTSVGDLSADSRRNNGHPVGFQHKSGRQVSSGSGHLAQYDVSPSGAPAATLDTWAVVLVIDYPPDQHLSQHLGVYYRDIVVPLMAGLKYEERRDSYVSREAEAILSIREKAVESGTGLTPHIEDLITRSSLCAQLASLYKSMKKDGIAHLTLNDDIDMSVLLHTELFQDNFRPAGNPAGSMYSRGPSFANARVLSSVLGGLSSNSRFNGYLRSNQHPKGANSANGLSFARLVSIVTHSLLHGQSSHLDLAPWQTLLPLRDPEEMLREIDDESEGLLCRFLQIIDPTLTFAEYEHLLDTDTQTIIEIAEHLIYWRKARLIDAISIKGIYMPACGETGTGLPRSFANDAVAFAHEFPEMPPLPTLLAEMSAPVPFEVHTKAMHVSKSMANATLVWLLQRELIVQAHLYMVLVASPDIKRQAYEREEARQKHRRESSDGSANGGDPTDGDDEDGSARFGRPIQRSDTGLSSIHESESLSRVSEHSNITITSNSSTQRTGSSDGPSMNTVPRSPLPSSFPQSYPYMSAAAATAAAHPKKSHLGTFDRPARHSKDKKSRCIFLSALTAPSIIATPAETTAEEELWIAEIELHLEAASGGSAITRTFRSMLPWLDGTHHLDEILYRADIKRVTARALLQHLDGFIMSYIS